VVGEEEKEGEEEGDAGRAEGGEDVEGGGVGVVTTMRVDAGGVLVHSFFCFCEEGEGVESVEVAAGSGAPEGSIAIHLPGPAPETDAKTDGGFVILLVEGLLGFGSGDFDSGDDGILEEGPGYGGGYEGESGEDESGAAGGAVLDGDEDDAEGDDEGGDPGAAAAGGDEADGGGDESEEGYPELFVSVEEDGYGVEGEGDGGPGAGLDEVHEAAVAVEVGGILMVAAEGEEVEELEELAAVLDEYAEEEGADEEGEIVEDGPEGEGEGHHAPGPEFAGSLRGIGRPGEGDGGP